MQTFTDGIWEAVFSFPQKLAGNGGGHRINQNAVNVFVVRKDGAHTSVTPRNLIIVMLGSANRFAEGGQLLARGWQLYDQWAAGGRMVDPNKTL